MVTTTPPASVGLINAGPAIGAEQILFALISALPVSQPRSNVWNGSKVTIGVIPVQDLAAWFAAKSVVRHVIASA